MVLAVNTGQPCLDDAKRKLIVDDPGWQTRARTSKGAGYSDIEAGLLSERTTIVTTVHDLQVVDDDSRQHF